MSLIPMLYSDWWEDLDRPHHLWDQDFGTVLEPDDLLNDIDPISSEFLRCRPHRRHRRRFQPFLEWNAGKKGRGTSTVEADKNKFQVSLDVSQFEPDEITVKVVDKNVVVEAEHKERVDKHGWVSRHFIRKYIVPSQCNIDQVESRLASDGILIITAPRKDPLKSDKEGRLVKIQHTGKPAITENDAEEINNDITETHKDQPTPQQKTQQQQQHRGRKSTLKGS